VILLANFHLAHVRFADYGKYRVMAVMGAGRSFRSDRRTAASEWAIRTVYDRLGSQSDRAESRRGINLRAALSQSAKSSEM
jgi:hypothetical protein